MIQGGTRLARWVPEFDYNRVLVVGVAMDGPTPNETAVYVPQPDVPFHRYTWMSYLTPPANGGSNLIAEVTVPRDSAVDINRHVKEVLGGLVAIGVLPNRASARVTRSWLNEFGYPVYSHSHHRTTSVVLASLSKRGLYSV
ncbi:flavin-containing amine oxidoreductase family protein, partial [mine drainage metagenome]